MEDSVLSTGFLTVNCVNWCTVKKHKVKVLNKIYDIFSFIIKLNHGLTELSLLNLYIYIFFSLEYFMLIILSLFVKGGGNLVTSLITIAAWFEINLG